MVLCVDLDGPRPPASVVEATKTQLLRRIDQLRAAIAQWERREMNLAAARSTAAAASALAAASSHSADSGVVTPAAMTAVPVPEMTSRAFAHAAAAGMPGDASVCSTDRVGNDAEPATAAAMDAASVSAASDASAAQGRHLEAQLQHAREQLRRFREYGHAGLVLVRKLPPQTTPKAMPPVAMAATLALGQQPPVPTPIQMPSPYALPPATPTTLSTPRTPSAPSSSTATAAFKLLTPQPQRQQQQQQPVLPSASAQLPLQMTQAVALVLHATPTGRVVLVDPANGLWVWSATIDCLLSVRADSEGIVQMSVQGAGQVEVQCSSGADGHVDPAAARASAEELVEVLGSLMERHKRRRVRQTQRLAELRMLADTPFDTSCPHHEHLLARLWAAAFNSHDECMDGTGNVDVADLMAAAPANRTPRSYVRVDDAWKRMGFQGRDPASDFRGMGVLGLHCLLYFAEHHTRLFRNMIDNDAVAYPVCVGGIAVASMLLLDHLHVSARLVSEPPSSPQWETPLLTLLTHSGHESAFEEVFCLAMRVLHDLYGRHRAGYMDFPRILKELHDLVRDAACVRALIRRVPARAKLFIRWARCSSPVRSR